MFGIFRKNKNINKNIKIKKSKNTLINQLKNIFLSEKINFKEFEKILLLSDLDYQTTMEIIERLKDYKKPDNEVLENILREYLEIKNIIIEPDKLNIFLILGVNGVGKTTFISKIANYYKNKNYKILIAGADTYRAGAIEQLRHWAENIVKVDFISQKQGSDPAAVVYDAIEKGIKKDYNILIIDTAGRLHNKDELMNQLKKIKKVIIKKSTEYNNKINLINIMIIDATLGKNSNIQIEIFNSFIKIDTIALTKFDSTAKGGAIFSINRKYSLPISFVSYGEKINDLITYEDQNIKDFIIKKI